MSDYSCSTVDIFQIKLKEDDLTLIQNTQCLHTCRLFAIFKHFDTAFPIFLTVLVKDLQNISG